MIDGPENSEIRRPLDINSYPTFVAYQPRSSESQATFVKFDDHKSYDNIKNWILKQTEKAKINPRMGGPIVASYEPEFLPIVTGKEVPTDIESLRQMLLLTIQEVSSLKD